MYAKYVSMPTCIKQQVVSDMALLLSGSPVSALSDSCDKVNTVLVSTVAPGWTLVDDATGTLSPGYALSAPDANGLTTKYAMLISGPSLTGGGAMYISMGTYEYWNPITHVGTNPTSALYITATFSTTAVNTFMLFATPRSLFITQTPGPTRTESAGVFEFTREAQYLVDSSYPCFGLLGADLLVGTAGTNMASIVSAPVFRIPRIKDMFSKGDLTGAASNGGLGANGSKYSYGYGNGYYTTVNSTVSTILAVDANECTYFELRPLLAMQFSSSTPLNKAVLMGQFYDVYETNYLGIAIAKPLDTITVDGSKYMYFPLNSGAFALKME